MQPHALRRTQTLALTSTLFRIQLELADIDRSVYESIELRVACHPSESHERLVVRVLARALAHEDGLDFGRGLSHSDDPALFTPSPRGGGDIATWIDVGAPTAERLHRASKKADRVIVFTEKQAVVLAKEWSSRSIHGAEHIQVVQLPAALIGGLAARLDRKRCWYRTVQEGQLGVVDGDETFAGTLVRSDLQTFLASTS